MIRVYTILALIFYVLNVHSQTDLPVKLTNTRISNQGLWNVYFYGFNNYDYKIADTDLKRKGLYYAIGLEMHDISFDNELRSKINLELLGEIIYQVGSMLRRKSIEDGDDKYQNPTVFTTFIADIMGTKNFYVGNKFAFGGGLAFNDLFFQFNKTSFGGAIDEMPSNEYGLFIGPAAHFDFLITKSITFHTDVYRNFGFYFYRGDRFEKAGETKRPFDFWRASAMVMHQSGFFIGTKYSHVVNKTSFELSPARLHFSIGFRQKMYKYNGESYKDDPRHNIKKETF